MFSRKKKEEKRISILIEKSGLFDKIFYLKEYHDVRISDMTPLEHYVKYGLQEDRKPNIHFDPIWYRDYHVDVEKDGVFPFIHYILFGQNENRIINKLEMDLLENIVDSSSKDYKTYEELFNIEYYLNKNPDVRDSGIDAFEHYQLYGWKEGRKPNLWFDPLYYLEKYDDIKNLNYDPLFHYFNIGRKENRKTIQFKVSKLDDETKEKIPKVVFDDTSNKFIEFRKNEKLDSDIKTIAFYLPQFHPFPENDEWWGKGFTEWTNVTKAESNFTGHYQPHLPIHNGFYDLRLPEIMIEQAKLAKNYGIHGFNFYYYWFDGKILMHKPFEILLEHKEIDINYCITWANENWTRRWDGAENDILIGQNHCDEDSTKFIHNMFKYFEDERYIKVDNKPVLIIYRADIIPRIKETIELWRNEVKKAGFDGIYLICSQTFGIKSPEPYGFDAAMEFPPHTVSSDTINNELDIINDHFEGNIYDYNQVVENSCSNEEPDYKVFKTMMLSWDNTARKQDNSHIFANFNLLKYKQWLSNKVYSTLNNKKYKLDEKFIFINAWNEWAEGTHLEPDRKFGYSYLQTTYDVLKNTNINKKLLNKKLIKTNNIAVILHIHFTDLWEELNKYLKNLDSFGFDLYITLTNTENDIINKIIKFYPNANIRLVENRGRDILPFIDTYKEIKGLGYDAICKIHSKKSQYRDDGSEIRNELYESLLGSKKAIHTILNNFNTQSKLGLITNSKYLIEHTDHNMTYDKNIVNELSTLMNIDFEYYSFPAGSMFWFKPKALNGLENIENTYFEIEEGLADGTVAHSIERLIAVVSKKNKFDIKGI